VTVLPLPLTPYETLYWRDDNERYPMNFIMPCHVAGVVDRAALLTALRRVLPRHPLLTARIDGTARPPCWVPADGEPDVLWVDGAGAAGPLMWHRLEIERRSGLRVIVEQAGERACIYFQFQHACCDGLAALAFMGEVFIAYHLVFEPGDPEVGLRELDVERLRTRGAPPPAPPTPHVRKSWRQLYNEVRRVVRFVSYRGRPIAIPAACKPSAAPFAEGILVSQRIDAEALQQLRSQASEVGATVNDLLVFHAFRALSAWNLRHQPGRRKQRFRMAIPTSLRGPGDKALPAAVSLSYAIMDRSTDHCHDLASMLAGIRDESREILRERIPAQFWFCLAVAVRFRRILDFVLRTTPCLASIVVSNISDPVRRFTSRVAQRDGQVVAGNLVIEDMSGAPPVRSGTRMSICISLFGGGATIAAMFDPHVLTRAAAADFLRTYVELLSAAGCPGEPSGLPSASQRA